MRCTSCGEVNNPGAAHCARCGRALDDRGESMASPAWSTSAPPATSGKATASLVFGILGLVTCCLSGIPGLILGILAHSDIKNGAGRLGGSGLATAGIVLSSISLAMSLVIIPILAAIAVPNFLEAHVLSRVSRVQGDMHVMATALESFYIDNSSYPPMTRDPALSIDSGLAATQPGDWSLPAFRREADDGGSLRTLTTPVAYVSSHLNDPFATAAGRTYAYYKPIDLEDPELHDIGWIIWSAGPDLDYDLRGTLEEYNPMLEVPSPALIMKTYDPTNGATSSGDVWRVKQ